MRMAMRRPLMKMGMTTLMMMTVMMMKVVVMMTVTVSKTSW